MRQFVIDPKKTAMENLFAAAKMATGYFRGNASKKGLQLSKDEWDELEDMVVLRATQRFMNKLRSGGYSREHSFYLNVWSSVFEVFYQQTQFYLTHVIHRKMMSLDRLEPERAQFYKDTACVPKYASNNSERKGATSNMHTWLKRSVHNSFCNREDADDFWSYLECCDEFNIEPDPNSPLFKRGRDINNEF